MDLISGLAQSAGDVVGRSFRSLVVLHNGRSGVGAGVVWGASPSGGTLILTNNHVVAHGNNLQRRARRWLYFQRQADSSRSRDRSCAA